MKEIKILIIHESISKALRMISEERKKSDNLSIQYSYSTVGCSFEISPDDTLDMVESFLISKYKDAIDPTEKEKFLLLSQQINDIETFNAKETLQWIAEYAPYCDSILFRELKMISNEDKEKIFQSLTNKGYSIPKSSDMAINNIRDAIKNGIGATWIISVFMSNLKSNFMSPGISSAAYEAMLALE